MLYKCFVFAGIDGGPTLNQHWFKVFDGCSITRSTMQWTAVWPSNGHWVGIACVRVHCRNTQPADSLPNVVWMLDNDDGSPLNRHWVSMMLTCSTLLTGTLMFGRTSFFSYVIFCFGSNGGALRLA